MFTDADHAKAFGRVLDRYSWWYATTPDLPIGQVKPKDVVPSSYEHAQAVFRALLPKWAWLRVLQMSSRVRGFVAVLRAFPPNGKAPTTVIDTGSIAENLYELIDKATTENNQ
jgi:hypothetical protein